MDCFMVIAHRGLKLAMLLVATPDDITHIKIVYFSFAKLENSHNGQMEKICGIPQYVAQEVTQSPSLWSFCELSSASIVLFTFLDGNLQVHSENEPQLCEQIPNGAFNLQPVLDLTCDK